MIGHPLKVRELLEEISRGELLLPEFQRAYVWKTEQVVRLIDSLYHDYPTGQILLWDTTKAPLTKGLEGVSAPRGLGAVSRPKVVLDGQQRLTSLYKALAPAAEDPVDVCFHLDSEQFSERKRRYAKDPRWVSIRDVLGEARHDLEVLQAIAADGGPSLGDPGCKPYLDRLRRLRRIADYAFPIEIFRSDDFEEVTELFVRINSSGTRLRRAELVLAQLTLRLPGAIVDRFDAAVEAFGARGFELDPRFLVRALVAVGTGKSRLDRLDALWANSPAELDALWERTRAALERAVTFVRHNARFQSSAWLPSLNALVPLVAFFDRQPATARDVEVGLARWLYLATLRGRYSASVEARLDQDLAAAQGERPVVALLEQLLATGQRLEVDPAEVEAADRRSPLFALLYAAARQRGATDWFSGVALGDLPPGQDVVIHPVFPRALLDEAGVAPERRDELANLVFLAAPPTREVAQRPPAETLTEVAARDPKRLESQGVPLDRALWQVERYDDFLAARREALADAVNALLDDPR